MGTILAYSPTNRRDRRRPERGEKQVCEIVIFPGVRIERHEHDLDLGHRVRETAGRGDFDGIGGNDRPRKTS